MRVGRDVVHRNDADVVDIQSRKKNTLRFPSNTRAVFLSANAVPSINLFKHGELVKTHTHTLTMCVDVWRTAVG